MQYVNGYEVSAQCLSEILHINDKVKLPLVYEQDGISVFEKYSERHYLGKCQTTLNVPAEFAFTQLRHCSYEFLPGCVEHKFIERYNNDNQVLVTRLRSPALEGHLVEYCSFVSCFCNVAKQMYAISFRGINHEQAQFSEGALVIELLPTGYIIDIPPGTPEGSCRVTLIFQVDKTGFMIDGSTFSKDQVTEVAKREYQNIYFKTMSSVQRTFNEVHPDPYTVLADDTYQTVLDVMASLSPAHGWTCRIQKYGLSVFTKRAISNELIVCSRITWAFNKPPSVVREAFSFMNFIAAYPNVSGWDNVKISEYVSIMQLTHPSLFVSSGEHETKMLWSTNSVGDRYVTTFCSISEDVPFCLPSGIFIMPIEGGGTRLTCVLQSMFSSDYLPWPEHEAAKIVATQVASPLKNIRDKLMKGSLELPIAPLPQNQADEDAFEQLITNYSNMFVGSFDHVNETTPLTTRFPNVDKRKREDPEVEKYAAVSAREFSTGPVSKEENKTTNSIKPFLFLMSKNENSRKRFKRVIHATSGSTFDSLSPYLLSHIADYLEVKDVISLAGTCRFFSFFVHDSEKTWRSLYLKRWNAPNYMTHNSDWRESYIIKTSEEKAWKSGNVKVSTWEGHNSRLKSILWDQSGLVASASYDKTVKIWDPDTNTVLSSLELPGVVSLHASLPPHKGLDILRFLAPRKNGLAEWWEWRDNVATKSRETRFGYSLKGLIILPHQTITWDDEIVKVWDNTSGNPISVFSDHTGKINKVIAMENKYFAVASADNTISVRPIVGSNGAAPIVINGHSKSVNCLQSLSSDLFASGSSDMYIKLWDLRNLKDSYQTLLNHSGAVRCFYATENILASGGDDMKMNLYFGRRGPYSHARTLFHPAKIHHMVGFKNNILIGDNNGLLKKWTFTEVDD